MPAITDRRPSAPGMSPELSQTELDRLSFVSITTRYLILAVVASGAIPEWRSSLIRAETDGWLNEPVVRRWFEANGHEEFAVDKKVHKTSAYRHGSRDHSRYTFGQLRKYIDGQWHEHAMSFVR